MGILDAVLNGVEQNIEVLQDEVCGGCRGVACFTGLDGGNRGDDKVCIKLMRQAIMWNGTTAEIRNEVSDTFVVPFPMGGEEDRPELVDEGDEGVRGAMERAIGPVSVADNTDLRQMIADGLSPEEAVAAILGRESLEERERVALASAAVNRAAERSVEAMSSATRIGVEMHQELEAAVERGVDDQDYEDGHDVECGDCVNEECGLAGRPGTVSTCTRWVGSVRTEEGGD